jgi:hypothetical protein
MSNRDPYSDIEQAISRRISLGLGSKEHAWPLWLISSVGADPESPTEDCALGSQSGTLAYFRVEHLFIFPSRSKYTEETLQAVILLFSQFASVALISSGVGGGGN